MFALQSAAAAFDRQAWSSLLQPLVKLWDQLTALAPPSLRQAISSTSPGAATAVPLGVEAAARQLGPVDTFVALERAYGVALLQLVARVMAGIKGVIAGEPLAAAVQVG